MMNKKKKHGLYLMIAGVVLAISALLITNTNPNPAPPAVNLPHSDFEIGDRKFKLEKLATESQREKGLSGRPSLAENTGLLFIFEKEDRHGFWMKDMNFPISIIWLDGQCKVTGFKKLATPESYPEVFYPQNPSLYVVEVNPLDIDLNIGDALICSFLPK